MPRRKTKTTKRVFIQKSMRAIKTTNVCFIAIKIRLARAYGSAAALTPYKLHFAPDTALLTTSVRESVDQGKWNKRTVRLGKLGTVLQSIPEHSRTLEFPDKAISVRFVQITSPPCNTF